MRNLNHPSFNADHTSGLEWLDPVSTLANERTIDLADSILGGREPFAGVDMHPTARVLAEGLARAKSFLRSCHGPIHLSFVHPLLISRGRFRSGGLNTLSRERLRILFDQMEWLRKDNPDLTYEFLFVDDGCPRSAGKMVEHALREMQVSNWRVLFLQEAIDMDHPACRGLYHTQNSMIGGSVHLGMWEAVSKRVPGEHYVLTTGGGLSYHLAQTGLLVEAIQGSRSAMCLGRRMEFRDITYHPHQLVEREMFFELRNELFPDISHLKDLHSELRCMRAESVIPVLKRCSRRAMGYELELVRAAQDVAGCNAVDTQVTWLPSGGPCHPDPQPEEFLDYLRTYAEIHRVQNILHQRELRDHILDINRHEWDMAVRAMSYGQPLTNSSLVALYEARGRRA